MTESSERGAVYYHLNIILSLILYIQLLSVWNQNVNIFSKVYYIHSVFLATCTTVCSTLCTSRVADVPYILLLLGTPASVNTACRIGWLRSVTTQRIENNYFFNCFTRMTKRDIYISKIILTSINQYIENFHRKFFSHGMGWDIQKKMSSHGMGRFSKPSVPSHPMGYWFSEKRPMGWDGMGSSHPTRSPDKYYYFHENVHAWFD